MFNVFTLTQKTKKALFFKRYFEASRKAYLITMVTVVAKVAMEPLKRKDMKMLSRGFRLVCKLIYLICLYRNLITNIFHKNVYESMFNNEQRV